MLTSVHWLNAYLAPADLTADEAVRVLEAHCFPIESVEPVSAGGANGSDAEADTRLDVELTSNRGDCFSHLRLAEDIAAVTGRAVNSPVASGIDLPTGGGPTAEQTFVENRAPELCPLFTARVIRNVTVGPSPAWLRRALEAVGQRSINNVVDVSNYVLLELGHPSHTFDLNALAPSPAHGGMPGLVIRHAEAGERLAVLDGKTHELQPTDLVVADAERPVSLAGVIGGLDTGVTEKTADVLLEVATWDPATVRRTARRLGINTDAGYRFARTVDARDLAMASDRAAQLILEVAGGELSEGSISAGGELPPRRVVELRLSRCERILGVRIEAGVIAGLLGKVGFDVEGEGEVLRCAVPHRRAHDVTREIDVIEEVGRLHGIDKLEIGSSVTVKLDMAHPPAWAQRESAMETIGRTLAGLGFFETTTFSFVTEREAQEFLPPGMRALKVDEARRKGAPYLRPSIVPSLLQVRKGNQDARVTTPGGVRLFETAAVFADESGSGGSGGASRSTRRTAERRNLALLADAPEGAGGGPGGGQGAQEALRLVRAAVDALVHELGGSRPTVRVEPADLPLAAFEGQPAARVSVDNVPTPTFAEDGSTESLMLGYMAVVSGALQEQYELDGPAAVAELGLAELIRLYPPHAHAALLPAFPGIERDLSVVVDDATAWSAIERSVDEAQLDKLERVGFVGVYRGKQVGAGRKSVTLRLGFRDEQRTLRHDEVDPQMQAAIDALRRSVGAEVRN